MSTVQCYERNERIRDYLSLVRPIAKRFSYKSGCDCDDLIQVGCLGLIQASHRFNQTRAGSFNVFARLHIRGAILHYLRDSSGLVRLPRQVEERALKIRASSEQFLSPDDQIIKQQYKYKTKWVELNEEYLPDSKFYWKDIERSEQYEQIHLALKTLTQDEQDIVRLVVVEGASLRTAGKKLGVSAMTIQRRLKRALAGLRDLLNSDQSA